MIDRHAIDWQHWQPKIGGISDLGAIVHGFGDLEQAIRNIVLTEKGSVPGQPEKCTALQPYLDRRAGWAIPYVTREIFDALRVWEPRINVVSVDVSPEDYDHYRFPVSWHPKGDVLRDIRRTTVILPENRRGAGHAA